MVKKIFRKIKRRFNKRSVFFCKSKKIILSREKIKSIMSIGEFYKKNEKQKEMDISKCDCPVSHVASWHKFLLV